MNRKIIKVGRVGWLKSSDSGKRNLGPQNDLTSLHESTALIMQWLEIQTKCWTANNPYVLDELYICLHIYISFVFCEDRFS